MTRHRQGNDKARMGHGGCNQADRDRMRLNETGREGAERGVGLSSAHGMAGAGTCEREACGSQSRRAAHKRAAV